MAVAATAIGRIPADPGVRISVAFAAMGRDMDWTLPAEPAERVAARKAMKAWAKASAKVRTDRDAVIKAAVAAGIDTRTIQQETGVARTTIGRIVKAPRYRRSQGKTGL
jgi:hypothetical protein